MDSGRPGALSDGQLADYERLGFLESIPILSADEVRFFRGEVDRTCRALGGRVTRFDAAHLAFRWAWDLATHPRILDCLERLIGPNILLKSTRVFYKYGPSRSFVGWHQDGITERIEDAQVPTIWLGLTDATAENGCLRLVPRSHRLGLIAHAGRPHPDNLTSAGVTARAEIDSPRDIVMRAGEMSLHHPLVLHGSNPNVSNGPRIGFSATYATSAPRESPAAVAWVRGDGPRHDSRMLDGPPGLGFDEAVAAYRQAGFNIRYDRPQISPTDASSGPNPN